jgi:hypothetical protein
MRKPFYRFLFQWLRFAFGAKGRLFFRTQTLPAILFAFSTEFLFLFFQNAYLCNEIKIFHPQKA